jgi:GTPase SAR1 family protein
MLSSESNITPPVLAAGGTPRSGRLTVKVNHASFRKKNVEIVGNMDPYVRLKIGDQIFNTKTAENAGTNPAWNEEFTFDISDEDQKLEVEVYAENMTRNDVLLGRCTQSILRWITNGSFLGELTLTGEKMESVGAVHITAKFLGTESSTQKPVMTVPSFQSGRVVIQKLCTKGLRNPNSFLGGIDPYIQLRIGFQQFQTDVVRDAGADVVWDNVDCVFEISDPSQELEMEVRDNSIHHLSLGRCKALINKLTGKNGKTEYSFDLQDETGSNAGRILVTADFVATKPSPSVAPVTAATTIPSSIPQSGRVAIKKLCTKDLKSPDLFGGGLDPYIRLKFGTQQFQTAVLRDAGKDVVWDNLDCIFDISDPSQELEMEVLDKSSFTKDLSLGRCKVSIHNLTELIGRGEKEYSFALQDTKGSTTGQILVTSELLLGSQSSSQLNPLTVPSVPTANRSGRLAVKVCSANQLINVAMFGEKQDPYVRLKIADQEFKTQTVADAGDAATWDEEFSFDISEETQNFENLEIEVVNQYRFRTDTLIGKCTIPILKLITNGGFDGSLPLLTSKIKPAGNIVIKTSLSSSNDLPVDVVTDYSKYDLADVINNVKKAISKGTNLWKYNQKDECYDVFLESCVEITQRVMSEGLSKPVRDAMESGKLTAAVNKQRGAVTFRKALDKFLSDAVQPDFRVNEEKAVLAAKSNLSKAEEGNADEKYMKEALSQGKKEWRRSKIMIVGEGRAGKTALANSILGRAYENLDSTIGINEFTCSIGYASVGGGAANSNQGNEKGWKELKDQKKSKEYETAVASMIFDQKTGKMNNNNNNSTGTTGADVDEMAKKLKGGYMEGEHHRGLSSMEFIEGDENLEQEYSSLPQGTALNAVRNLTPQPSKDTLLDKTTKTTLEGVESSSQPVKAEQDKGKTVEKPTAAVLPPQSSPEIDTSLVMKYLGEQSAIESKFVISVFDFGGQSVFNVIHPFFLTRFGVYVITFNMEWLSSSTDPAIRDECIRYMSFWLNSVIIHTQTEKGEIAPIIFVGTRKDLINTPAEHQAISTFLYDTFCNSLAWSYVIENKGAEGPFGKANLCFFPVNNKLGNQDPTVQKLLVLVEETIDKSNYVHVERPLSWFQVLDNFKSKNVPYLEYSEVESIVVSCNIPKDRVPTLLRFFHEMGILMWHDEDTLRDIIVFDPIEYFVKPATIIICKHVPDKVDGIYHSMEIHDKVKKLFPKPFQEMTRHGIVSEPLLVSLLEEQGENYKFIEKLMLKYGLLVPLILTNSEEEEEYNENERTGKEDAEKLYLAPALLPENSERNKRTHQHCSPSASHCFSFIFTPSKDLSHMPTIELKDCRELGFLPSGLFEKLITKALGWSMKTSDFVSRASLYNCFKNYAELAFGNQHFLMMVDYHHNLITVEVLEGNNPMSIHDRLKDQIDEIISECLKSLNFISVLKYHFPANNKNNNDSNNDDDHRKNEDPNNLLFVRLDLIRSLVEKKSSLSINGFGGRHLLSTGEAKQLYGPWLTDFLSYTEFDLFISYRWGHYDTVFTKALFDRISLHAVDQSMRTVKTFLDVKRLQAGENFQKNIVNALSKSLLIVPIVSSDALQRMIILKETDGDNLLLEWICGLELLKHRNSNNINKKNSSTTTRTGSCRLTKFMPIFFGTRTDENNVRDLFKEDVLSKLPNIRPKALLELAKNLLNEAGIAMSAEMSNKTVKEIVTEVSAHLFLCAWEPKDSHQLTVKAANKIVANLNECLEQEQNQQQEALKAAAAAAVAVPQQSTNTSPSVAKPTEQSSSAASSPFSAAWTLLQEPRNIADPSSFAALQEDLGLYNQDGLEVLELEDLSRIASLLKKIPQKQFQKLFSLV